MYSHDEQNGGAHSSMRTKMLAELMHHMMSLHGSPSIKPSKGAQMADEGTHPQGHGTKIGSGDEHFDNSLKPKPTGLMKPSTLNDNSDPGTRSENELTSMENSSKKPANLDSTDDDSSPFHQILGRKPSAKGMW